MIQLDEEDRCNIGKKFRDVKQGDICYDRFEVLRKREAEKKKKKEKKHVFNSTMI